MSHLSPRVIIVGLIVTLALAIPISLYADKFFYSGQIPQNFRAKVVELRQLAQEEAGVATSESVFIPLDVSQITLPPEGFPGIQTQVSTDLPPWGEGEPVLSGNSVKIVWQ